MVKYELSLDMIFGSLSDPTRRDILRRVSHKELSINEVALPYKVSLAAISKHLNVLEGARLITKEKRGKQHMVRLAPETLANVDKYLQQYKDMWDDRFQRLDSLLEIEKAKLNNNKKKYA
jgi:DNA-binding transcriptional ArsR family regulator